MKALRRWGQRLWQGVLDLLRQGVTPDKLSLSLVLGVAIGVFPILGTTTLLCGAAAVLLRLNIAAMQLVNYAVYPLQLALILPFMHLGTLIFGGVGTELSVRQMAALFEADFAAALQQLGGVTLGAVGAWGIVCGPLAVGGHLGLRPVLQRVAGRLRVAA